MVMSEQVLIRVNNLDVCTDCPSLSIKVANPVTAPDTIPVRFAVAALSAVR
jgi:hypothetical protein